jgi:hypothetical protein
MGRLDANHRPKLQVLRMQATARSASSNPQENDQAETRPMFPGCGHGLLYGFAVN